MTQPLFLCRLTGFARSFGIPTALLLVAGCSSARAQSIDYGALESLFGEPVTTSVTGSPQRASQVPASMIIVTAADIRRSGARDIPGVLRHLPGIDVLRWTNDQADVAVRGYNQDYSPRLLVLVDGRQVYADDYGYMPWSTLPIELSDIRQIEIVMGPNSALYGFNAVGGVINIVTYDPLYDRVNTAALASGTQGRVQGSAVATIPVGDSGGLRLSIGGWNSDDFSTLQPKLEQGIRQGDTRKAADLLAHFKLGSNTDVRFEVTHSEVAQPELASYLGDYARYRTSSISAQISSDTDGGLISARSYLNWFNSVLAGASPAQPVYRVTNPVVVIQLQDIFKPSPDHTLRISAEYRHGDMNTSSEKVGHVFYDMLAAGLMWSWSIEPDLTLTNAIRADHLSLGRNGTFPAGVTFTNDDWDRVSRTEISFNSGLVWRAGERDTLRVTAARGVQLPNLFNLGGLLVRFGPFVVGGVPTLKPTTVMNYGFDWDHAIPEWNAILRLRAYHQTTDGIVANFGGAPQKGILVTPANIGSSRADGLELVLDANSSTGWRWSLGYAPELIEDNFGRAYPTLITLIDFEHTHPVHVVNASLGWSNEKWELDGYLRYESEFQGLRLTGLTTGAATLVRIPNYVTFDARAAYHLTNNLTLAVSGQNLLDSPQRQTGAAAVERTILISITADF
ncbi:MAG: TonB-dependent receptor [Alphaproteobacteria bacterium]|nr:TonB-dependent receptor [Alphaproteobacteria bacterium]